MLHHFLLAFETIRQGAGSHADAKEQLTIYYEQLKQSILENDSYVDALLEPSDVIYTVNLTNDILERIILLGKRKKKVWICFLIIRFLVHIGIIAVSIKE